MLSAATRGGWFYRCAGRAYARPAWVLCLSPSSTFGLRLLTVLCRFWYSLSGTLLLFFQRFYVMQWRKYVNLYICPLKCSWFLSLLLFCLSSPLEYIYIYMHICTHIYIYVYMYIYMLLFCSNCCEMVCGLQGCWVIPVITRTQKHKLLLASICSCYAVLTFSLSLSLYVYMYVCVYVHLDQAPLFSYKDCEVFSSRKTVYVYYKPGPPSSQVGN